MDTFFRGRVLLVEDAAVWAARANCLYKRDARQPEWKHAVELPVARRYRAFVRSRLGRRVLRQDIHHLLRVGQDVLGIIAFGRVFFYSESRTELIDSQLLFRRRPLVVAAHQGMVLYGEYFPNQERVPVRLIGVVPGEPSRICYEFQNVRHIHSVSVDPRDESIWVATGDDDSEVGIWRFDDLASTPEMVVGGEQSARAVQLVFSDDHIYFGSDAPNQLNHLFRMSRNSFEVERLQRVSGPVFYARRCGGFVLFSTVCEPSSVNDTEVVRLYSYDTSSQKLETVFEARKDLWPMKYAQYGQILFPAGVDTFPHAYFTPMGTVGDQRTFRLSLG